MIKKSIFYLALCQLLTLPLAAQEAPKTKFDRGITQSVFVPKGQWIGGLSMSYSEHSEDNHRVLVLEKINSSGYNVKASPMVAYTFRDNVAAGGRLSYSRSLIRLDNVSLNLSDDINFDLKDIYSLSHSFSGTAMLRTYLNLGDSKRFGLYNEVQLTYEGGQSKIVTGRGDALTGTFQKSNEVQVGISPGLVAFVNNFTAVEVSVGVMGFNYKKTEQVTDQVHYGERSNSSANFKINLFSISLGLAFYL